MAVLDAIKLPGAALAGALAAAMPAATWGYFKGQAAANVAALTTSVKVLRDRGEIDAQVSASAAADLCGAFGLQDGDRDECVRRLADPAANAGNGGARNDE